MKEQTLTGKHNQRKILPSCEVLDKYLSLDTEAGILTWKVDSPRRTDGTLMDWMDPAGYIKVSIHSQKYHAHRVIWKMHYREEPPEYIDHENGIKTDNRISNLRESSAATNQANAKTPRTNTSGVKGVCYAKTHQAWKASIRLNRKRIFLGYFKNIADAENAVRTAREKYHGTFAKHY